MGSGRDSRGWREDGEIIWQGGSHGDDSRKLKDHPDVPGESRMEGTRANLGIKIGPDVTVGSVQGSPKRSVNIHCDPNWWARLFHWSSSCSCIRHYLDESGCGEE